MWDFCQIAKHGLCDILKTNHCINAKPTEHFIPTTIKLLVEKGVCDGPNSLTCKFIYDVILATIQGFKFLL